MRLLKTIRLDATDTRVFETAAASGEWAVPGGFAFAGDDPATLTGKRRQAFRSGFLGLESFGWSTFTVVATIDPATCDSLIERLARHLVERYGAPDPATARPAAAEELAFAAELASHPPGTLVAVERELDAAGHVRERFRTVRRPEGRDGPAHGRVWELSEEPSEERS